MTRSRNAAGVLRNLAADLAALVWPVECAGCGLPDRACCDACLASLLSGALAAVQAQDGPDEGKPVSGRPATTDSDPPPLPGCDRETGPPRFWAGPHEGLLRELLVPFKHAGRTSLVPILGEVLALPLARGLLLARGPDPPLIVPIPSRPERVRERGFRHVELLARAALRTLRQRPGRPWEWGSRSRLPDQEPRATAPVVLSALRTLPGRTTQVGLRAGERRRNAARIEVRRGMRHRIVGREVILLDDVRTTGETLDAAAGVLSQSGAKVVAIITLAQAQRHAPQK